jgi:hypothetical protein
MRILGSRWSKETVFSFRQGYALPPPSKREAFGYTQKREPKKSPSGRGKVGKADRGRMRAAKPLLASDLLLLDWDIDEVDRWRNKNPISIKTSLFPKQ